MTLKKKLWLLKLSEVFIFFHLFSGVLIPFFTIRGGLSLTQIMLIQAWFSLVVVLLEIPTGTLADTLGRKNTILFGVLAFLCAALIYGTTRSFGVFFIAEGLWGLSTALFSGAKEAMVYDTLIDHHEESHSKTIFRQLSSMGLVGLLISAPIGSFIAEKFGVQWPMLFMSLPILLSGVLLFLVPEPKAHRQRNEKPEFRKKIKEGWKMFKDHPYLSVMTLDMVLIWTFAFMIVWFQQLVLTDLQVDVKNFGWFVSFSLVIQLTVLAIYPRLEKILGNKVRVLFLSGILPGLGFLLLAWLPSIPMLLLAQIFCSGFGLSRRTLYSSYVNKFIPSSHRATINSFINMGINIAGIFVKPLIGFLADINISTALITLGVGCLAVSIFSRVEEHMLLD